MQQAVSPGYFGLMQDEIPSLSEMPLGPDQQRLLSYVRILAILLGMAAFAALFLPNHLDYCAGASNPCIPPLVHGGFAHDVAFTLVALGILLLLPLATLVTPARARRIVFVECLLLLLFAPVFWVIYRSYRSLDALLPGGWFYEDLLAGGVVYTLCLQVLGLLAILGPFIRLFLHWSARRVLLRERSLPIAVVMPK